ncbi:MAG TPA: hypothetical protein VFF27_13180 [Bacteroidia bacterium]|jgi:hypothetical protein|nr:hypothetical protein [Bacteroidia bacterium]
MKFTPTLLLFIVLLTSCKQEKQHKSRFDNIPLTDKECKAEVEMAKKKLEDGKLIFCDYGYSSLDENGVELAKLLKTYDIQYEHGVVSDVVVEGQTTGCYGDYLLEQIEFKYGKKFIDSLENVADSIYISKNKDKLFDYTQWSKPPLFPGDKRPDPTNHDGLQAAFEKSVIYPGDYEYKTQKNSMAMVKVDLDVDATGKAKAKIAEFIFFNPKTQKDNFNASARELFGKTIISLIEQTKWIPAMIKTFPVKSKSEIFVYFK